MLLSRDFAWPRRRTTPFGCSAGLHLLLLAGLTLPLRSLRTEAGLAAASAAPAIVVVSPESIAPRERRPARALDDLGIELPPGATRVTVDGFTFDFATVISRAGSLFPFLDPLLLADFVEPLRAGREAPLPNPLVRPTDRPPPLPPLRASDADVQALVDQAWSRRDRWRAFRHIAALSGRHDPHEGRLVDVLRGYGDQNLLQLFVDGSVPDPRLWAQLAVAADHRAFADFILAGASRHPSTKGRAELLFLLDKILQSNLHALSLLLETNPEIELMATRAASVEAFRALVQVRRHYMDEIERRGLDAPGALVAHYGEARLTILRHLVRTTPGQYRAGDAQYLIGTVLWNRGEKEAALATWRGIVANPTDTYYATYSDILAIIRSAESHPVQPAAIEKALARQQSAWMASSIERLLRFGYHVNTF
ncbi:MAG TPA: hypothetical protein VF198_16835 [Vicinamibacterales bacterium]